MSHGGKKNVPWNFTNLGEHQVLLPLILWASSFPASHSFLTRKHWSALLWLLVGETLYRSPEVSLFWYCVLQTPAALISPDSALSPYITESAGFHLGSCGLETQQVRWNNRKAYLVCFSSLSNHCLSLCDVRWLENHSFMYFSLFFLVVLAGKVKSGLCYSTSAGSKSQI